MIGSSLLTRLDMSDVENVRDAAHELRRAGDDAARLAVWAAKWGASLVAHGEDTSGSADVSDELEVLREELEDLKLVHEDLRDAATGAAEEIERIACSPDVSGSGISRFVAIAGKLKAAT